MFESIAATFDGPDAAHCALGVIETGAHTSGVVETPANAWDLLGRFECSDEHTGPVRKHREWGQHQARQDETVLRRIVPCPALEAAEAEETEGVEDGEVEAGAGSGKAGAEGARTGQAGGAGSPTQVLVTVATIRSFSAALADTGILEATDSQLVDLLRVLEELKSAAAAVQARAAAVFDASQRRAQARAGVPAGQLGRGVGAQVALARRDSPHRGSRHLGFGKALVHEMPHTLAALSCGVLSEWRATLLVRETACLDVEDRHRVDELVCADPSTLEGVGDRKLIARIRSITQSIDPASQVRRNAKAVSERYVSCRPAPDTMAYLTGLLPVAQGVAVYAALSRAADSLRASGDERGRGQIMADTLVERVTGQTTAGRVPVEVQVVITDRTLLSGLLATQERGKNQEQVRNGDEGTWQDQGQDPPEGAPGRGSDRGGHRQGIVPAAPAAPAGPAAADMPAYFPGYGIVPGAWARELISSALGNGEDREASPPSVEPSNGGSPPGRSQTGIPALVTLRRLFVDPASGELTAMESKARAFPAGLARLIRTRDQTCRTPWCDAPIRHIDHIQPHADGGPTSYTNGQGLCEACNQAKEAPGWNATASERVPLGHSVPGRGTAALAPGDATSDAESIELREPESASMPVERGQRPRNARASRHSVRITTPTGHTYSSTAPPLPGTMIQFG